MARNDWTILDPQNGWSSCAQFGPIPHLNAQDCRRARPSCSCSLALQWRWWQGLCLAAPLCFLDSMSVRVPGIPPVMAPLGESAQGFRRIWCKGTLANSTAGPLWTMSLATSLASSSWQFLRWCATFLEVKATAKNDAQVTCDWNSGQLLFYLFLGLPCCKLLPFNRSLLSCHSRLDDYEPWLCRYTSSKNA